MQLRISYIRGFVSSSHRYESTAGKWNSVSATGKRHQSSQATGFTLVQQLSTYLKKSTFMYGDPSFLQAWTLFKTINEATVRETFAKSQQLEEISEHQSLQRWCPHRVPRISYFYDSFKNHKKDWIITVNLNWDFIQPPWLCKTLHDTFLNFNKSRLFTTYTLHFSAL